MQYHSICWEYCQLIGIFAEIKKGLIANCKFHIISGTKELDNKNNFQYLLSQITQISCLDPNVPPQGCTQYYYGSATGSIQVIFNPNWPEPWILKEIVLSSIEYYKNASTFCA